MHKRLSSDLMSLAHEILTMKNKNDVFALKKKAAALHEKLAILSFVEEYIATTPNLKNSKEELEQLVIKGINNKENGTESSAIKKTNLLEKETHTEITSSKIQDVIEQPFDEIEEIIFSKKPQENIDKEIKTQDKIEDANDLSFPHKKEEHVNKHVNKYVQTNLEEELEDTLSVDVAASLFDVPAQKSLNDKLATSINIGLNDRIAFVKTLFNGSQEDYNRVISQLNTFKTEKEAKQFLNKIVKPDYDWSSQEEMEARFVEIIERRFA